MFDNCKIMKTFSCIFTEKLYCFTSHLESGNSSSAVEGHLQGCCKWRFCEHFLNMCFWSICVHISVGCTQERNCWVGRSLCVVSFGQCCQMVFERMSWCSPSLVGCEVSSCSTSSSVLVFSCLFNFSPPSRCAVYFSKRVFFVSSLSYLGFLTTTP